MGTGSALHGCEHFVNLIDAALLLWRDRLVVQRGLVQPAAELFGRDGHQLLNERLRVFQPVFFEGALELCADLFLRFHKRHSSTGCESQTPTPPAVSASASCSSLRPRMSVRTSIVCSPRQGAGKRAPLS